MDIKSLIGCDETKPYIFISYAHKDGEKVLDILERMAKEGYNIWFDHGIEAGTNWDDNIAMHIDKCSFFISFMSGNYLNSGNCKDELNYARDLNKDILLVYLDSVKLPSGMAMRLNRSQGVVWDESDDMYEGEDLAKIINARGIEKTKTRGSMPNGRKVLTLSDEEILLNKCPNCSAELPKRTGAEFVTCTYCGSTVYFNKPKTVESKPAAPARPMQNRPERTKSLLARKPYLIVFIIAGVFVVASVIIGIITTVGVATTATIVATRSAQENAYKEPYSVESSVSEPTTDLSDSYTTYETDFEPMIDYTKEAEELAVDMFEYCAMPDEDKENMRIAYVALARNPNEDIAVTQGSVNITLKAADGHVIDVKENYIHDLIPGESVYVYGVFACEYTDELMNPDITCDAVISFAKAYDEEEFAERVNTSEIEVSNIYCSQKNDFSVSVTGEVTNNSANSLDTLELAVVAYKDGVPVFMDCDYAMDVKKDKKQAFSLTLLNLMPEYDEVMLYPILY